MISKAKIKFIKSLEQKKFRHKTGCFVAEGPKISEELLKVLKPQLIAGEQGWLDRNEPLLNHVTETSGDSNPIEVIAITPEELKKISFLQHPQEALGIFSIPDYSEQDIIQKAASGLVLALDGVQDPGNLGTIIRIADWFGIHTVFCSLHTADVYNPKTVQATMGSIARVQTIYTDLAQLFTRLDGATPVYGTFLDGTNIYESELSNNGIIIMGNEGNGISDEIMPFVNQKLYIPNYAPDQVTAESLNVAIATAVTCAEFRRRLKK